MGDTCKSFNQLLVSKYVIHITVHHTGDCVSRDSRDQLPTSTCKFTNIKNRLSKSPNKPFSFITLHKTDAHRSASYLVKLKRPAARLQTRITKTSTKISVV